MVYSRGLPQNYNKWSSEGCKGWSYDEVLPYFIKSEKNQNEKYKRSGKWNYGLIREHLYPDVFRGFVNK